MKTKIYLNILAAGMLAFMGSCASDEPIERGNGTDGGSSSALTSFSSVSPNRLMKYTPRTSMGGHDYLAGSRFYWEPGDNIYVKDDNNALQKSGENNISATQPRARFKVPGAYTAQNTYEVYYTGAAAGATSEKVIISTSQTQTSPNTAKHIGGVGDCGTSTATRVGDHFEFMLNHKAAYLCFLPRVTNAELGQNIYLKKIVVKSDNAIAGDYTLSMSGLSSAPTANAATEITLTTLGTTLPNGFPLSNTATDVATNAAYMVIAPGTHSLTVDYYIKDPVTKVEGVITKTLPVGKLFLANNVYDITANLTPKDYASEYYTAEESEIFNLAPNSNLMVWYAEKGSPHWDTQSIWSTQGHLYCKGMWYKKASVIAAENGLSVAELNERDPQGNDLRPQVFSNLNGDALVVHGRPLMSNINDYFYVPALGGKLNGENWFFGKSALYFTSNTQGNAVGIHLSADPQASRVDPFYSSNYQLPLWFGESSSPLK
ncbi:hypothetical protein [Alloprevotella rava]|uniref:Fimbrillin family protein n=1 Tax=Alloprevotella rava TaxID=671218 RepID=A0A7W5UE40_9BACT|nr:hypothetical protein [Alloprevotella rava]MBB3702419.1 hypothetical protein [Alloprevotella rava]